MTQLIASNQLTLTNVNDGQSIKDNLFSATNFALTKYANATQPTVLVSWKYNGKPNTKYTLSTDIRRNNLDYRWYDLFFDTYPSTPSSATNGVAIDEPRTITSDATGIVEITVRVGPIVDDIIAKTSLVKLEENDRMTAFIFHPDDQIGDKGADGLAGKDGVGISSTTITYASSSSGTTVPTSGWTSAVPSVTPGQYLWTKTFWTYTDSTSETGYSVARMGANGTTTYTWIKYADTSSGSGMSQYPEGKRYIGMAFNKTTATESAVASDYKWSPLYDNVQVGGSNLLLSSDSINKYWVSSSSIMSQEGKIIRGESHGTGNPSWPRIWNTSVNDIVFDINSKYTISFYARSDRARDISYGIVSPGGLDAVFLSVIKSNTEWRKYTYTFTPVRSGSDNYSLNLQFYTGSEDGDMTSWLELYDIKLEKGNVSTDWSPAPEDVQSNIDSKADQALTLAQKTELEERMGIIESELQARALLDEMNAWFEEYTLYKDGLATDKAASETKLTDLSGRIDAAVKNLGDMSVRWNFLDTYMKPGNEGLMIGKIDGSTSIRVSDNRIAFYSGGKEVAFISNDTLEIENGIFTTQLQVGRFQTSQYGPNPDANIVKYVGGK
ncbi:TPA: hypothetical protein ACGOU0_000263 [Streptococcus suis]